MAQEEPAGQNKATPRTVTTHASADPDLVLTETQNWSSRSHRELYDSVHLHNEPGRVGELAEEWTRMGGELEESAHRMTERLRRTEAGWQSQAADAARAAIEQLAMWCSDAGQTAGALGDQIARQGRVMEVAKTAMPEPVDTKLEPELERTYTSHGLVGVVEAVADVKRRQDQANAAHGQAVAVMERMETDSRALDGATSRFVPPPNPIHDAGNQSADILAETEPAAPGQPGAPTQSGSTGKPPEGSPAGTLSSSDADAQGDRQQPGGGPGNAVPPLSGDAHPGEPPGGPKKANAPTLDEFQQSHSGSEAGGALSSSSLDSRQGGSEGGNGDAATASGTSKQADPGGGQAHPTPPRLDDSGPTSTSSQSATSTGSGPSTTPNPGGDQEAPRQSRPTPTLDGTTVGGRGPSTSPQQKKSGSDGSPKGWSGSIPPIPSSSSGPTITGGGLAGGPSDPGGPGGPGGPSGLDGPGGPGGTGGPGGSGDSLPPGSTAMTGAVPGISGGEANPSALGGATGPGGSGESLSPGGRATTGAVPEAGSGGANTSGSAGSSGQAGAGASGASGAGMAGMGGMPPAARGGQGGEAQETRSAKYVEGGQIVEVPGADLPPPVIGGGKPKKTGQGDGDGGAER